MKVLKQCVGIDISKDSIHACFAYLNEDISINFSTVRQFSNDENGFVELLKWTKSHIQTNTSAKYLMEATGVYYEHLSYFLHKKHCKQHVILPNKSKNFFKSLNIKTKTDSTDAKYLAQLGLERNFSDWQPPVSFFKQLRSLTRYYYQLQDDLTVNKNQLHSFEYSKDTNKFVTKSKKQIIDMLTKQMEKTLEVIKELISDEEYAEKFKCIRSITGVGLKTAATIVAETQGFHLIRNRKQLVSFAGYDVSKNQSGTSVNGAERISKKGNKFIRKALHFPALSAVRASAEFDKFFNRIYGKRHIKMIGYVAVQRKMLLLIYALWTKNEMYDENHHSNQCKKK